MYARANLIQNETNYLAILYIHGDIVVVIDLDALVDEIIVRKFTFAFNALK